MSAVEQQWLPSQTELDSIFEPVRQGLERAAERLGDLGNMEPAHISEPLGHLLKSTGKRMRPALTLLAAGFHPGGGANAEAMAAAVELLHVASLVHDDTVDNSDIRRGRATLSSLLGRNAAVLLGDYVFAASATFVCDTGNVRVIRRFAETIMELSAGQLREKAGAYNPDQTREEYFERIYGKTASLFATAGESGAVLSGAPEPEVQALKDYSYNLGMAFQVVDDILDFDGASEEVGKPVGSDLAQGIITLPAIMVLERYPGENPVSSLCRMPGDAESLRRSVELVQTTSAIEDSFAVAHEFCDRALDSLTTLHQNTSRDSLEKLVSYVITRRT